MKEIIIAGIFGIIATALGVILHKEYDKIITPNKNKITLWFHYVLLIILPLVFFYLVTTNELNFSARMHYFMSLFSVIIIDFGIIIFFFITLYRFLKSNNIAIGEELGKKEQKIKELEERIKRLEEKSSRNFIAS